MRVIECEKRRDNRRHASDAISWRPRGGGEFRMGWLLESSDEGLAFAWRGAPPFRGTLIEIRRWGAEGDHITGEGVVRHVLAAHDDLCVVGVELRQTRSFPPSGDDTNQERPISGRAPVKIDLTDELNGSAHHPDDDGEHL